MGLIVYSDFSCPECYLASRRVDALRAAGVEVDWRAVEHDQEAVEARLIERVESGDCLGDLSVHVGNCVEDALAAVA